MAEKYSFFNSKDHDRRYNAQHWADYFFPLFRSGVFNGDLQVTANDNMTITIATGYAWIDGYVYHLTEPLTLDIETASGNANRMDNIVIQLDHTNRWIKAKAITGGYYAKTATPKEPEITTKINEVVIARISVAGGRTKITQSMITDTRMDKELCGWVCGAVQQIDFAQITAQFDAFFAEYKEGVTTNYAAYLESIAQYEQQTETEVKEWIENFQSAINDWTDDEKNDFEEWYNHIKDQLTEDAAGNLQSQIDAQNETISTKISEGTKCIAQANTSPILDSTDGYINELKIYGMSGQEAAPTPDNPQKIYGIGKANVVVSENGKNLFRARKINTTLSSKYGSVKIISNIGADGELDGTITVNGIASGNAAVYIGEFRAIGGKKFVGCPAGGSAVKYFILLEVKNSSQTVRRLYDYGDGIEIPSEYNGKRVICTLRLAEDNCAYDNMIVKPMLTADMTATYNDYEPCKTQEIALSETLNAVPVADGGNITIDGQQYIADCINVESGKLLQRVITQRVSGIVGTGNTRTNGDYYATVLSAAGATHPALPADNDVVGACLCNICTAMSANDRYSSDLSGVSVRTDGSIELCIAGIKNETDFKNYLSNNEVTIAYAISDSVEIDLLETELQKLKNLVTYAAGTRVSIGADWTKYGGWYGAFELKYFARTKGGEAAAYADAKLRDLAETVETNNNTITTKIAKMQTTLNGLLPNSKTVTIGSVTAADSATISGTAKKIKLLVKKVTASATTGAAIYQYINLPTTEDGVTAPKLSALTAAISTSHGTIAVSGEDILLKSVKGFSITAIIDYKNY